MFVKVERKAGEIWASEPEVLRVRGHGRDIEIQPGESGGWVLSQSGVTVELTDDEYAYIGQMWSGARAECEAGVVAESERQLRRLEVARKLGELVAVVVFASVCMIAGAAFVWVILGG